jgi:hypothetical protein
MLETSKDLLFVILAFCFLWLTVFMCWALYYIVVMLKNFSRMTISVREKLESGSNHVAVIAESVIKMVGFLMDKQESKSGKKKKK